jgi:hypothetical protein
MVQNFMVNMDQGLSEVHRLIQEGKEHEEE